MTKGALKPSTEGAYYLRPWQRPWNLIPIVRAIRNRSCLLNIYSTRFILFYKQSL